MCTLTWTRSAGSVVGYELFFNRDELKTRRPALPPEEHESAGDDGRPVRFLAAIDADAGGTWLGVNEHGLAVGLLNGWRDRDRTRPDATSRGLLVKELLGSRDTAALARRLARRGLAEFRSFTLIALEPGKAPVLRASWDGEALALDRLAEGDQPISSSSKDPEGAARARRAVWSRLASARAPGPAELAAFHASHEPEPGAWSPCMHREDAETVSFTRVLAAPREVSLTYRPGPACGNAPEVTRRLSRDTLLAR